MNRPALTSLATLALAAVAIFAVGCNNRDRVSVAELRWNPTPELDHLARSNDQVRNDHARILDNQNRALWDDLDRLLLVNDNARMSPYVLP